MLTACPKGTNIIVLDTSAFVAGFDPLSIQDLQYSAPEVQKELIPHSLSWTRFHTSVERGRLRVKTPDAKYVKSVRDASMAVGDLRSLSQADLQVLALGLELKEEGGCPDIVTDDYSIQNVAHQLNIRFTSLMTLGIRYRFRWILYCPACHHRYPASSRSNHCEICGTRLKRKPERKTPV